jgi:hypothetical protein
MGALQRRSHLAGKGTMTDMDDATNMMRAIVQDTYGSVDVLQLGQVARPQIAENEVLVEVRAAGLDVAGTVVEVGSSRGAGEQRINLDLSQRARTCGGLDHDFSQERDLLEPLAVYSPKQPII